MPVWASCETRVQWRVAIASLSPRPSHTLAQWAHTLTALRAAAGGYDDTKWLGAGEDPLSWFHLFPGASGYERDTDRDRANFEVLKAGLLSLEARFHSEGAGTGLLIPTWNQPRVLWRTAVAQCRTPSQVRSLWLSGCWVGRLGCLTSCGCFVCGCVGLSPCIHVHAHVCVCAC